MWASGVETATPFSRSFRRSSPTWNQCSRGVGWTAKSITRLSTASRAARVRAPLTSSATTRGGRTTNPPARASSSAGTSRPAKKSIQTEVSTTTPLTRLLEVDLEPQLPLELHRLLERPPLADEPEPFDERLGDPLPGHCHRVF